MVAAAQGQNAGGAGSTRWDGASEQSLAEALIPPATDCIEADAVGRFTGALRRTASDRRLGLTVTARSVYRHPIAKVFVGALQSRLDLSPDLRERVRTALQEAMVNAMLHGNLGLDSAILMHLQAFVTSHDIIETRLASKQVACSKIRVEASWTRSMIRVVVRDSGVGFNRSELPSPEERLATGHQASGRGLLILEKLCDRISMLRGGTTIELGFLLSSA